MKAVYEKIKKKKFNRKESCLWKEKFKNYKNKCKYEYIKEIVEELK